MHKSSSNNASQLDFVKNILEVEKTNEIKQAYLLTLHTWRLYMRFLKLIPEVPDVQQSQTWCRRVVVGSSTPDNCLFIPCQIDSNFTNFYQEVIAKKYLRIVALNIGILSNTFYCKLHDTFHMCNSGNTVNLFSLDSILARRFSNLFSLRLETLQLTLFMCRCDAYISTGADSEVNLCKISRKEIKIINNNNNIQNISITPKQSISPAQAPSKVLPLSTPFSVTPPLAIRKIKKKTKQEINQDPNKILVSSILSKFILSDFNETVTKNDIPHLVRRMGKWIELSITETSKALEVKKKKAQDMFFSTVTKKKVKKDIRLPILTFNPSGKHDEDEDENDEDNSKVNDFGLVDDEMQSSQFGSYEDTNLNYFQPYENRSNKNTSNPTELVSVESTTNEYIINIFTPQRVNMIRYADRREDIRQILNQLFYSQTRTQRHQQLLEKTPNKANKALEKFLKEKIMCEKIFPSGVECFMVYEAALMLNSSQSPALEVDLEFINRIQKVIYKQWIIICLSPYGLNCEKKIDFTTIVLSLLYMMRSGGRILHGKVVVEIDSYVAKYLMCLSEIELYGYKRKSITDGNDIIFRTYESLNTYGIKILF